MTNPERILRTLDRHLRQPTRVVLFGRAALALGYEQTPAEFAVTQDVDALLPGLDMARIEADRQFWAALDATNRELEPSGLYMTHLFADTQVVIAPDWWKRTAPVEAAPAFRHLELSRPATVDLILTKMMRHDPQDMDDIRFLLGRERMTTSRLEQAFAAARVPPVPEIREAFQAMQPAVLAVARSGPV